MARKSTKRISKGQQSALGVGGATALYMRVSTQRQVEEGFSLDAQRVKLEAHCIGQGWTVDEEHVYVDEGVSGSTTERPRYQAMLAAVAAGDVRRIVAIKLDRISRNTRDFLSLLDYCDEHGTAIVSMAESFDTGTPVGRAVVTVLMAFAELERKQIAERLQSGRTEKARQGERNGAPVPYGYELAGDEWRTVPHQAHAVGFMFREFNAGKSLRAIADELNRTGLPAPRGAAWYPAQIRYILDNGLYAGLIQYNGHQHQVESDDVPAIVDRATYDAAGARLATLRRGNPTFGKSTN